MFVEAARRWSDIRRSDFKTGIGAGVLGVAGLAKLDLPYRSGATKTEHGLQFYIGLGPDYEFMEENSLGVLDFHCGVTGERCVSGSTRRGCIWYSVRRNRWGCRRAAGHRRWRPYH